MKRMNRTPLTARAARWSATHPWKALGMWMLFVATAVVLSGLVTTQEADNQEAGSGPSRRADEMLDQADMTGSATEQVLVTAPDDTGDDTDRGLDETQVSTAMEDLSTQMAELPEVDAVSDVVWSASRDAAMLPITIRGDPDDAGDHIERLQAVTDRVAAERPDLRIEQTGSASLDNAIMEVVDEDLANATSLSLPVTLVIMLLAFGALIAAAIPVLLALSAVVSSFGLYASASYVVPDMGSVANMIMLIGMAVGVDYSLFFVKRQREERERGNTSVDAVEIAARTAGHSIMVSGLAVIVSVSALFLVGNVIFSGLAAGAILVVAVAMLGSLTVVPALVAKLGRWVDRPRIPLLWRLQRRIGTGAVSGRVVASVLRRPKAALTVSTLFVVVLAAPVFTMSLREASPDQLPDSVTEVETMNRLQAAFPSEGTSMSSSPTRRPELPVLRGPSGPVMWSGRWANSGTLRSLPVTSRPKAPRSRPHTTAGRSSWSSARCIRWARVRRSMGWRRSAGTSPQPRSTVSTVSSGPPLATRRDRSTSPISRPAPCRSSSASC